MITIKTKTTVKKTKKPQSKSPTKHNAPKPKTKRSSAQKPITQYSKPKSRVKKTKTETKSKPRRKSVQKTTILGMPKSKTTRGSIKPTWEKPIVVEKKTKGEYREYAIWYDEKGKKHQRSLKDRRSSTNVEQPFELIKSENFTKTMRKKIPRNLLRATKSVAKAPYEHSIMIDFERKMVNPERTIIIKGGRKETARTDDYELFGHTHPTGIFGQNLPAPSNADLQGMTPLKPEFIVAGNTGAMYFFNIEDKAKYEKWKQTHPYKPDIAEVAVTEQDIKEIRKLSKFQKEKSSKNAFLLDEHVATSERDLMMNKVGREMFFEITGVRAYPAKDSTTLEMKDDPTLEEIVNKPKIPKELLQKWHAESPSISNKKALKKFKKMARKNRRLQKR